MTETYEEARARVAALKATSDKAHGVNHGTGVYKEMGADKPLIASASAAGDFAKPLEEMTVTSAAPASEADIEAAVRAAVREADFEA